MSERHCYIVHTISIALGAIIALIEQTGAATVTAKSISLPDVRSAIRLAGEGDIVIVPAGTASWTSTLSIAKGITLIGAGDDKTVILDDIPRTPANKSGAIIIADLKPKQSFRLSGITFRAGSITTKGNNGAVRLKGTCPAVRVDHCHFDRLYQTHCIHTLGWLYGVIDHCVFDCIKNGLSLLIWHDTWGGKNWGEGSWAEPAYWGSEKFIFIEDNIINNLSAVITGGVIDGKMGGRAVVRYNHFHNADVNSHGTEYGPQTGVRAYENYNNTFEWTMTSTGGQLRGGTTLIHDNTFIGTRPKGATVLACYRLSYNYYVWEGANGDNPWDLNDTEGNGTNVPVHKPHVYLSGTHTGADNSLMLVAENAGWLKDQWVGYQLTNTSRGPRPRATFSSTINANTSNTMTYSWDRSFQPLMTFNKGDHFDIHKCLAALDQPGRGKRKVIGRGPGGIPLSAAWPNQELEPVYAWNNKWNDQDLNVVSVAATVIEGRDFYNNTMAPDYKPYVYPHPLVSGTPARAERTTADRRQTTSAISSSRK